MTQVQPHQDTEKRQRIAWIILAYPFAMLLIAGALNLLAFGIVPAVVSLPSASIVTALAIAAALLVINHAWHMTSTELTRLKFRLFATPEEWEKSATSPEDAASEGLRELARHHNAHRNTTENAVYFVLLAGVFVLVSPPGLAAYVWLPGFALARLGYTLSYLTGRDDLRGLFMSLSLIAMFGLASYLLFSLIA